jgi:hypothetical protein
VIVIGRLVVGARRGVQRRCETGARPEASKNCCACCCCGGGLVVVGGGLVVVGGGLVVGGRRVSGRDLLGARAL